MSLFEYMFGARRAQSDESCKKRLEEVEERLRKLELESVDRQLHVLDLAEKVAAKLKDRTRKSEQVVHVEERKPRPWERSNGIQSR
jgi:hypothetical protein